MNLGGSPIRFSFPTFFERKGLKCVKKTGLCFCGGVRVSGRRDSRPCELSYRRLCVFGVLRSHWGIYALV